MNKIKMFFKKNKNLFLIVFTIFMFLLFLLTAYSYGYDKGINSNIDNQTQKVYKSNIKRSINNYVGTPVPVTGYISDIYLNINATNDEINTFASSLNYVPLDDFGFSGYDGCFFFVNSDMSLVLGFVYNETYSDYFISMIIDTSVVVDLWSYDNGFISDIINANGVLPVSEENDLYAKSLLFGQELQNNIMFSLVSITSFTFVNNDYESGYQAGLQAGYIQGYEQGVYNSTNPLVGFDNTKLSTFYYTDTDTYLNDTDINFGINGYTYDLTSEVQTLKEDRFENSNGSDSGTSYIVIYDFQPYISKLLDFTSIGFDKIIINYNNSTSDFVNISDYRQYTESTFNTDKIVISIELYFNALLDLPKYELNLIYNNTYQNGYQSGYSEGLSQGTQNGFREGYTEGKEEGRIEGYEIGKTEGYNQGYNVGNSETCKLNTLVFSIADVPVFILSKLLGFELFGMNLFVAFCSVVTIILIIFLVKKFSK